MHVRILVLAALVSTALAGCVESEGGLNEWEYTPPEERMEETQALNATGDEAEVPANVAPEALLAASVVNGTAPLNVTFTLEATDADGDNLTWSFDAGDGNTTAEGTELPATVDVTYLAGNWTATFTVSDGTNETVETVVVAVAEVPDATEDATNGPVQVFTGSAASGSTPVAQDTDGLVSPCVGFVSQDNGLDCYYFEIPAEYAGRAFDATSSSGSADASFWTGCDPAFDAHTGSEYDDAGTIPADTTCVVLWYFGLAPTGVDFTFNVY